MEAEPPAVEAAAEEDFNGLLTMHDGKAAFNCMLPSLSVFVSPLRSRVYVMVGKRPGRRTPYTMLNTLRLAAAGDA